MRKYRLVLERLKEGQKITIVYQGEFGGVTAVMTTYLGCKPAPHYQNCPAGMTGVSIIHKPQGRRKARYKTIPYNVPLAVYDGWRDIDADSLVFRPVGGGLKESRYAMHDSRYFADLLSAWPDGVIFSDIPGRQDNE